MSKECQICHKKPFTGKQVTRRGIAKRSGGIGLKTTGINARRFYPNLQTVKVFWNGGARTMRVCVKCIKAGKIQKPPRRLIPPKNGAPQAQS